MATPEEMLEELETATSVAPRNGGLELSQWEADFINSITEQLDDGYNLTERQIEKLTEIWDKT